ncbi:prepilin-type N-terminal cleavage/methylation domain-containing protein [Bifidobacterium aquikefiri]
MKKMDKIFRMRMSAEERENLHRVAKREGLDDSTYMRGLLSKQVRKCIGFTLIELVVTMIIIAILAGIATPIFLNQRKAAWKATVKADVSNAKLVAEGSTTEGTGSYSDLKFTGGASPDALVVTDGDVSRMSPTSPGNTLTAFVGKTAAGDACYSITGKNVNTGSWSYTMTSAGGGDDCAQPDPNRLVGGKNIFYGLTSDGVVYQVDASTAALTRKFSLANRSGYSYNSLGISADGEFAYAIAYSQMNARIIVEKWSAKENSVTTRALTSLPGLDMSSIVSGEVDADGNYWFGGLSNGDYKLFSVDSTLQVTSRGTVSTGISASNGDFTFDSAGNLVIAASDASNTNIIKVSKASLVGSTGTTVIPTMSTASAAVPFITNGLSMDTTGAVFMSGSQGGSSYFWSAAVGAKVLAVPDSGFIVDLARSYAK